MDGSHFDTLTRSLITASSRRRALAGLLLGSLGLLGSRAEEAAAKNCRKIKNRKKRKKCLKKAKSTQSCTPSCGGKACGDDGCGGSCGPCFRGSCQGGVCVCPSGQEVCDGVCLDACDPGEVRVPFTCGCCATQSQGCVRDSDCCSNDCDFMKGCQGHDGFEACTFDEQCSSGACEAGKCLCGAETCGNQCVGPCEQPDFTYNRFDCTCCINNTFDCPGNTCTDCNCCGTCNASTGKCEGRPANAPCDFDAQCANNDCLASIKKCSGGIGP